MLQTILLVLVGIVAIIFILALLTPKDFVISAETIINKPKDEVFNYVKLLRNLYGE
jgi:uncharacterized protein involved in exopolysaccharide biosynthesis